MAEDRWSRWLLERRFGGDEAAARAGLAELALIRDRVLDDTGLAAGETLLDVGCGDGLIGFGALARVADCRVIFCDISAALLDRCREIATELDLLPRCDFIQARAEALGPIRAGAVEVVTTRSVLIFVRDKAGALREFHRVLRPGGRLSLFEPINRFALEAPRSTFAGYDVSPVVDLAARVRAAFHPESPDENPMTDFDERDLFRWAREAGFDPLRLDYRAEIAPPRGIVSWEAMLTIAPNPNAPTLAEAMDAALTPDERDAFVAHLRPLVDARQGRRWFAVAYLSGLRAG